jgi:hypothetical protein
MAASPKNRPARRASRMRRVFRIWLVRGSNRCEVPVLLFFRNRVSAMQTHDIDYGADAVNLRG